MADWGYEDYEYQWHSDSCLMEIFVHEQDAKKYVADGDGKTIDDYGMGYLNYPNVPIHFEIEPRELRTGWRSRT